MNQHVVIMPATVEVALDAGTIVLLEFGTFQPMPNGRMDVPWRYEFIERGTMDLEAVEEGLEELMRGAKVIKVPTDPGCATYVNDAAH